MLALAGKRAKDLGLKIGLIEGDAERLPFPDDAFDTVLSTYALCSVPDDARAILEMRRVLRPGGRLILVDFAWERMDPDTRRGTSRITCGSMLPRSSASSKFRAEASALTSTC
jgi:ubiquinone/menaquinone biosynthesis C-methylase UbiE